MKCKNRILFIAIFLEFFSCCLCAQEKNLTLDDCLRLALENNIGVRSAALKEGQAVERKKEMFTSFFPSIDVSASGYMMNRYTIDAKLLDIPILQYLKNGTIAMINAIQPIYTGGRLLNGNRLAKVGVDVSRLEKRKSSDQVLLTTQKYFWDIVVLKSKLNTINSLDSMINRLLKDVTLAINAGVKMRNDLLQVQLKQNEIISDRLKVEHGLTISQMLLEQYIGEDNINILYEVNPSELPSFPLDLKKDHDQALIEASDYQLLENNVKASKLNKRLELGKSLPQVAVGAGLFSHDLLSDRQNRGIIYATVSVPITSWWGGSHAIKRLKMAEEQAKEQLMDDSELLLIQMQNYWNTIEEAYQQLVLCKKSISQSEENLRLQDNSYRAGTVPLSDLLEAQSLYQQALDGFASAVAAYNLAISEYKIATSQSM